MPKKNFRIPRIDCYFGSSAYCFWGMAGSMIYILLQETDNVLYTKNNFIYTPLSTPNVLKKGVLPISDFPGT